MRSSAWVRAILASALLVSAGSARAQTAADEAVDAIRKLTNIGPNDQRQIKTWIDEQITQMKNAPAPERPRPDGFNAAAAAAFRATVQTQFGNEQNTPAFLEEFSKQLATVTMEHFTAANTSSTVVRALARTLDDVNRVEVIPALIAGVRLADEGARYLCVRGLVAQRSAISQDNGLLQQVTAALSSAGLSESNPAILGRIYEALAMPNQVSVVMPIYLKLLGARAASRNTSGGSADTAELFAFEFLRSIDLSNLDNNQRAELAQHLAVLLRLDATRYNDPRLQEPREATQPDTGYEERDVLERRLDACEAVLESLVGKGKGGNIREQLNREGHAASASVIEEVYKWIGNADANTQGALNAAPWNVPVGAP